MAEKEKAIVLEQVRFGYRADQVVLDIPDWQVPRGGRVFVHGPSGSGKTTLLGLLAGVLETDQGEVKVLGSDITRMSGGERDAFRGDQIGYIFQMFNLIPYLSVIENIALPCRLNRSRRERVSGSLDQAAKELATRLEIEDQLDSPVSELSVGQQQRVAAARALIGKPGLIIADEPTSALDTDRRARFLELLFDNCDEAGATLLFVSHDRELRTLFTDHIHLTELNRAN